MPELVFRAIEWIPTLWHGQRSLEHGVAHPRTVHNFPAPDARAPPGQFFLASTSALGLCPLCAHGALSVEALSCVRAMRRVGPSLALHLLGGKLTKDRLAAAGVDEALLELTAGADNWVERRALSKKLRRTETHQGATQKAAEARRKCVRRVNFEKEDRDALRNGLHADARMACSLCSS